MSITPAGSYGQSNEHAARPLRYDRSHVLATVRGDAASIRDRSETPGE